MEPKKALKWVIFWISIALAFNAGVYYFLGQQKAIEFLTGYIIEESLSVDTVSYTHLDVYKRQILGNHNR